MREGSRCCNYCGSPIATIRCWRCLLMNVPEALHCMGCGAELGVSPVQGESASHWTCPRCRTRMLDAFTCDDGTFFDCAGCGGQFVPHEVLQSLVRRHQAASRLAGGRLRPLNPLKEPVTYLPCPSCRELMHRRNFGFISGVIIDVCAAHGNWFDVGELARILAFVGQGGLERGQLAKAEVTRARSSSTEHQNAPPEFTLTSRTDDPFTLNDMLDAGAAFAHWVLDTLRK